MAKDAKMKYPIITDYKLRDGYCDSYRYGKPEGVVLHEPANLGLMENQIKYQLRNPAENGIVHAWSNDKEIREILNTDYKCWGAGGPANQRFAQIESCRMPTREQAVASIDRGLFWAAYQLYHYNLPCTDATKTGNGTVWTHKAVSKFLGDTDHVDPIGYWESVGITWDVAYAQLKRYYDALHAGDSTVIRGLHEKEEKKNYADKPNKNGQSTKFSRGEYVRTDKAKATNFYGGAAIPADFHGKLLIVDWLNANGTISVRTILDSDGKQSDETYTLYEWDLVYTDQNPKQHFSRADKPDEKGRSTMFSVGQKVRTSGMATHYREGEKIEGWLHSQVLTVDYLNEDGSITVKPEIDTGARATFKRNLWEWDLKPAE